MTSIMEITSTPNVGSRGQDVAKIEMGLFEKRQDGFGPWVTLTGTARGNKITGKGAAQKTVENH